MAESREIQVGDRVNYTATGAIAVRDIVPLTDRMCS